MHVITAAAAIDRLRAAGHTVTRTTGRDAARRYGCQTLLYVIDGRAVNLGRLRQLAQGLAAEPVAAPEPVAARAPFAELTGDAAARFARFVRCYRLTAAQAREIRAEVWRWAAGCGLEPEGSPYVWIRGAMAAALVRRGVLIPRHGFGFRWEPEALAILREIAEAQAAAEATPVPVAAEPVPAAPWDPGTPEARANVRAQQDRVGMLWPIRQALAGAALPIPPAWATDGPVMAGEWPTARALAALPIDHVRAAGAALAALPPVTGDQARALAACRRHLAEVAAAEPVPPARAEWMVAPWRGQPLPPMRVWPMMPAV